MKNIWISIVLLMFIFAICGYRHHGNLNKPIEYIISKSDQESYALSGKFESSSNLQQLVELFLQHGIKIDRVDAEINSLKSYKGSYRVLKKAIPLFVSKYEKGNIIYKDNVLTLEGVVASKSIKMQMDRVLKNSKIYIRNLTVVNEPKNISFVVKKLGKNRYELKGTFAHRSQKEKILEVFKKNKTTPNVISENIEPQRADRDNILELLEKIVPIFIRDVNRGELAYINNMIEISGATGKRGSIERFDLELSKLGIEYRNNVILDMRYIKGAKAKAKAKKLMEMVKSSRVAKEAIRKAEKEISEDMIVSLGADDNISAQMLRDNERVRKNLNTLFKTETIEFNQAQTTLTPQGIGTVNKIAAILKAYPNVNIEIAGHTDSDGDDSFNMLLSQGRANSIKRVLVKEGISEDRIKAVGYGETKPLVPNTTLSNKKKNRRVEIIVIGE